MGVGSARRRLDGGQVSIRPGEPEVLGYGRTEERGVLARERKQGAPPRQGHVLGIKDVTTSYSIPTGGRCA